MEHEQAQDLLSEYLDGTLSDDQTRDLEAHLETCPECSQSLSMLRQAMTAVSSIPRVKAPHHFARRVKRRARQAGLLGTRRRRVARHLTGPFQSVMTMYGLLIAVGLLIVIVMIAQQQIELLTVPPVPADVHVDRTEDVAAAARCAWLVGATVHNAGRSLPEDSPLADPTGVELAVPSERWKDLCGCLDSAGLSGNLPERTPQAGADGRIRLVVHTPN